LIDHGEGIGIDGDLSIEVKEIFLVLQEKLL
jgi:hypothetical protein